MATESEEAKMRECFKKDQLLTMLILMILRRGAKKLSQGLGNTDIIGDSDKSLFREVVRKGSSPEWSRSRRITMRQESRLRV